MGNNFGTMFTRRNRPTPNQYTPMPPIKYQFNSCEECEAELDSTNIKLYKCKHDLASSETLRFQEALIFEKFLHTNDIAKQHKLFDKYNIISLDWLLVDIEGIDAEILLTTDWTKYDINKIEYEKLHLGSHEKEIENLFKQLGYAKVESLDKKYDIAWKKL